MKDADKGFVVFIVIAAIGFSILAMAWNVVLFHKVEAPSGRRGVPSTVVNSMELMAWPQTEDGFIKTVEGKQIPNVDMVFASAPIGQAVKSYVVLKADPNRIAETAEISANSNGGITVRWWETNVGLPQSDPLYTIPYRAVSTDGGVTWSEPQNISDLPETAAVIQVATK